MGILFSKKWNRSSLLGQALYKHTTKGFEGNYYGSLALQNITYSYQINPVMSCDTSNTRNKFIWNISGGLNSEWIDKIIEDNQMDENSGYFINFATLGASVTYRNWSIPLTFSLPIYQKVNGHQNNTQFRLKFGIAKLF